MEPEAFAQLDLAGRPAEAREGPYRYRGVVSSAGVREETYLFVSLTSVEQQRRSGAGAWSPHHDITYEGQIHFASASLDQNGSVTLSLPYIGWVTVRMADPAPVDPD